MKQALTILTVALSCFAHSALAQETDTNAPWSMADAYWDAEEMAEARAALQDRNGAQPSFTVMAERLELQASDDEDKYVWDAQAWYGGDINKLWIKSEGEYLPDEDEFEEAELQLLWSRAVSSFWDIQTGLRHDFEPDGLTHAVLGAQGVAPYWLELDAAAFLSEEGDLTARVEAEYELLFSQRLILQPRAELEFSAQDIPERSTGSGLTGIDAGLRLRYEIEPQFAPYIGVEWQAAAGETRNIIQNAGGDPDATVFLLGLRSWF